MTFKEYPQLILINFASLFYVCKIFGIIPHSFSEYHRSKRLINSLTIVIGLVLNYISPIMMAIDLFAWVYNRQKIIDLFDEFNLMDINLFKQGITVNNNKMRLRILILIGFTFISEVTITFLTYYIFDALTISYFISFFPTFLSALDKIWFSSLLLALRERFSSLNNYIDQTVEEYNKLRKIKENIEGFNNEMKNFGYLHKEILTRNIAFGNNNNKIYPTTIPATGVGIGAGIGSGARAGATTIHAGTIGTDKNYIYGRNDKPIIPVIPWNERIPSDEPKIRKANKLTILQSKENILNDLENLEDKLNNLCRLHDEMCEMGKNINGMWSIQMLLLMAYGFMSITAQFYFLYCSITKQSVPQLFISSENLWLSCIFVIYVAMKCVYVIFLSWQTRIEARRTGVCVHKCALAVDDNNIYEIVNHISLKLMNHAIDFTACGFFNLDMTTLYAVTGAITSYLIILIQFNLAGKQSQTQKTSNDVAISTTTTEFLTNITTTALTTSPSPSGISVMLGNITTSTTTLKPRT
ncbi:gustatory receptor for bitter taste 66a [Condylostylus longicornis]|uniref:gustatory receptor for bitter taste 66a n=1 Tax=Condylostylus longicornis TaxID=2530218 RepID=UPI00244E1A3F|nr:gustatory receptor for bitter taste 66a [Condylostylus longicornis]